MDVGFEHVSTLWIFGVIEYRFDKRDNYIERLDKLINIAQVHTPGGARILFHLEDSGIGSISAVDRIVKKFPFLKPYLYIEERKTDESGKNRKILSNITGEIWAKKNPNIDGSEPAVEPDIFLEIGKGIPRSFPLSSATFVFDQIDWRSENPKASVAFAGRNKAWPYSPSMSYFSSNIILNNSWGMSHREIHLAATVDYPLNQNQTTTPISKTDSMKLILESLGKIKNEEIISLPSKDDELFLEKTSPAAKELIEKYTKNEDVLLSSFGLPHKFYADNFRISDPETKLEFRKTMTDVIRGLGFKYQSKLSGYGLLVLTKETPNNNQATLWFDIGRFNDSISAQIRIQGPLWLHAFDIKFFPGIRSSYRLKDQAELQQVLENLQVVIEKLWPNIILPIDQMYGPTPNWYRYHGFS